MQFKQLTAFVLLSLTFFVSAAPVITPECLPAKPTHSEISQCSDQIHEPDRLHGKPAPHAPRSDEKDPPRAHPPKNNREFAMKPTPDEKDGKGKLDHPHPRADEKDPPRAHPPKNNREVATKPTSDEEHDKGKLGHPHPRADEKDPPRAHPPKNNRNVAM